MVGGNHGVESGGNGRGDIVSDSSPFDSLPEDCISNIVSFTSPRDACVVASVSKIFESAVKSDVIWEKFLPPEYSLLIPPSRVFLSKMEIYFALCDDPVLIENGRKGIMATEDVFQSFKFYYFRSNLCEVLIGADIESLLIIWPKKSFWLEKASGKRCIMLSAESLYIRWGDSSDCWVWIPCPGARFESVAMLRDVCCLEIRGSTNTRYLSPRTRYSAYIVFKEGDHFCGFLDVPIEAGVGVVGKQASTRFLCFDPRAGGRLKFVKRGRRKMKIVKPEEREDGWMEIELGGFFNKGGLMNSDEVEMSALETKLRHWKSGLIIQGIEIRPAKI